MRSHPLQAELFETIVFAALTPKEVGWALRTPEGQVLDPAAVSRRRKGVEAMSLDDFGRVHAELRTEHPGLADLLLDRVTEAVRGEPNAIPARPLEVNTELLDVHDGLSSFRRQFDQRDADGLDEADGDALISEIQRMRADLNDLENAVRQRIGKPKQHPVRH